MSEQVETYVVDLAVEISSYYLNHGFDLENESCLLAAEEMFVELEEDFV